MTQSTPWFRHWLKSKRVQPGFLRWSPWVLSSVIWCVFIYPAK
ncbi:hypothetical protein EniLVp02_0143 [Vibrio phage EniLVp02]